MQYGCIDTSMPAGHAPINLANFASAMHMQVGLADFGK
jgi:hypothetical protein